MVAKKEVPVDVVADAGVVALAPVPEGVGVRVPLTSEIPPAVDSQSDEVWATPMEPADYRQMGYVLEAQARTKHCVNGRHAVSSQHLCSGTQCMAWRAQPPALGLEFGYCGLAGDPGK
jgi:hypothetical protein